MDLSWTQRTPVFLLGALGLFGLGVAMYYSTRGNKRPGEEHGSAKWGNARQLNARYADRKSPENNVILTEHVQMSLDTFRFQRNLLEIIIGGSGAGKTRYLIKPNLMQANCSYIITDPKGEILRDVGPLLMEKGYVVKVFDLIAPEHSDCYNPFAYLRDDKDVLVLIRNFIKNTTPKNANSNDPFWEKSETALDTALMLYLLHEAQEDEQTFEMITYMLECAKVKEDDDYQSAVDLLFNALEQIDPDALALRQYKIFKQAENRTAKSILVTAAVRLAPFTLSSIQRITSRDELELDKLGERKQAVFCVIPDSDDTFNFLVGMLYTQAFQTLYYQADKIHGGRLPVPVRLLMDEFANVSLPDSFSKLQSTMRSRSISSVIVLQSIGQLKALFKDDWENIVGSADSLLYLGGNDYATFEYISKLLGKSTLDTTTRGQTRGRNGSSSTNFQTTGRELLTPDEVRRLNTKEALLLIRGEYPVRDHKYDLKKHPNIHLTADGGAEPYIHRPGLTYEQADLDFTFTGLDDIEIIDDELEEKFI
ncbi:VirD4-like conjugal transfer protein, CD1115 family [Pseudoflavonifractor phocaeensis]|uniref:VirD4-like conjugal transfer protein, CD1115 family n=1 Tax=Pseudoflavonifractor phocaeensis TaxID=1870988 RepID=UPI00210A10B7|nr:type IV secretory system conjugative DNA transfer family protein [Pseudoflavonifractor phocaeensis]MCQ4864957.1 type IV secretory system conjugative DNA transfer family protein [Pseudoflavonifractor phocaeensis]